MTRLDINLWDEFSEATRAYLELRARIDHLREGKTDADERIRLLRSLLALDKIETPAQ